MTVKLLITKLKPDARILPDVLGQHTVVELPKHLPDLADCHRTLAHLSEQAPLYIAIMQAAMVLFPTGVHSKPLRVANGTETK